MINRSLLTATSALLAFVAIPSLSFAQTATNAPAPATAPAATPAPEAAPAATTPPAATTDTGSTERPTTYTIAQGDTLWSISHKFDTSIKALQKLNGLKKHALLHIGQVIKIPPATSDSTTK